MTMPATPGHITYTCATCDKPIADGAGWLQADMEVINNLESDLRDLYGADASPGFSGTMAEFLERDDPPEELPPAPPGRIIPWVGVHDACATYDQRGPYTVDVDKINTREGLLAEGTRLREGKTWFRLTDWDDMERRALTQVDD